MTDVILYFKNLIPQELVGKLSSSFDERESQVRQAIEVSICSVLLGIKNCTDLGFLVTHSRELEDVYEWDLCEFLQHEATYFDRNYFLNRLFPGKRDRVSEMISNELCVKSESSRVILNLVSLLVLNNLKNEASGKMLSIQETELQVFCRFLPAGVRVILGVSGSEVAYVSSEVSETVAFGFSFFGFRKK